jgi:hypothetical protein
VTLAAHERAVIEASGARRDELVAAAQALALTAMRFCGVA